MSVIRVGSNEKYAEGWAKAFGGGKKKSPKKEDRQKNGPQEEVSEEETLTEASVSTSPRRQLGE